MDWTRIKKEYITSDISIRSLAKKNGISYSTLQRRATRENWNLLRQGGESVPTEIRETIDLAARRLLEKLNQAVEELDFREVVTRTKRRTEDAEVTTEERTFEAGGRVDCKDLKILTGALKDIRDIQMVRYPLDIREQEAKIRNLERQFTQAGDMAVTVTLAGESEEYAM